MEHAHVAIVAVVRVVVVRSVVRRAPPVGTLLVAVGPLMLLFAGGVLVAQVAAFENAGKVCETVHNTTCATASATCCKSPFSATGWGCCPLSGAVDCETPLGTCCPAGTSCEKSGSGWQIVVSCVPKKPLEGLTAGGGEDAVIGTPGVPVCKPGPLNRLGTTKKNCLVIGDSVSLGYTPFLAQALANECLVQHAPDGGDGGAEETAYGLECLDYFLSNPDGAPVHPDLILFNFGLHGAS